jgi:hypothetical protein
VVLADLVKALLETLAPWAVIALAAFGSGWWRRPVSAPEPMAWPRPVFGRYLALIAIALLALALTTGMTAFKSRWILPALAPVPLMAFALRLELDADPRGRRMTGLTLAVALAILAAAAAQPWFAYVDRRAHPFNYPAAQLARALRDAGYDGRGRIIAADHLLAGMLRTRFPAAPAAFCQGDADRDAGCVAANVQMAERSGQGWLVISFADRAEPGWWQHALAHVAGGDGLPRGQLEIAFRKVRPDQPPARYDFVWQPAPRP